MYALARGRILSATTNRVIAKRQLSALVSAADEFPGIPSGTPTPATASKVSVSTLSNGVTVVSEDSASSSTVSLTFPNAGSSSESIDEAGAALANKFLTFKSASGLSSALILRTFHDDGATPFTYGDKSSATVGYTCAPEKAVRLVPLLAPTCSFEPWDVSDALDSAVSEAKTASTTAAVVLTESIFAAAYGAQSSMGRPYYSDEATKTSVASFRAKAYGIKGAVLAATGISNHSSFCSSVEELLSESMVGTGEVAAPCTYMGGETRVQASGVAAQVALAFNTTGSATLASVLKQILTIQGAPSAFVTTSGLVGVCGSDVDALSAAVATKPSADVVKRAIAGAKSSALFSLESGSQGLAAEMTAAVMDSGTFGVTASYDKLTAKDVTAAYDAMLKTKLSMASIGDLSSIPYHATVAGRFS